MTLFNFLNFGIGICLLFVGAYSNMAYLAIIVVNIVIGIYQEIHARNLVRKLSIVSQSEVLVIRDGKEQSISTKELVLGDLVKIEQENRYQPIYRLYLDGQKQMKLF